MQSLHWEAEQSDIDYEVREDSSNNNLSNVETCQIPPPLECAS